MRLPLKVSLFSGKLLLVHIMLVRAAKAFTARPSIAAAIRHGVAALHVATIRDADFVERMVGGERYEMIPLPDSMISTTVFVGNLCEFVTDDILSAVFQAVSKLKSVPACVIRKPDMSSLQYGFVHFLSEQEKEVRCFHPAEGYVARLCKRKKLTSICS